MGTCQYAEGHIEMHVPEFFIFPISRAQRGFQKIVQNAVVVHKTFRFFKYTLRFFFTEGTSSLWQRVACTYQLLLFAHSIDRSFLNQIFTHHLAHEERP
jgi:hypothetical protein